MPNYKVPTPLPQRLISLNLRKHFLETGRDCLTNEGPTRLPEAFRALQAGKLPRKAGLIVVRHGQQYELTLSAESLSVSGANLPKIEGASGRDDAPGLRVLPR